MGALLRGEAGLRGPAGTVVVGTEEDLARELTAFADAGVTDLIVSPLDGDRGRVLAGGAVGDDGPVSATETAVLALVPAAEAVVGEHRRRLDPTAVAGVGAHVTVLYPFVPPAALTDAVVTSLRAAVAPVAPFACSFAATGWFGDDLLWLAPSAAAEFADLTARVWRAFPAQVPYGGEHEPHPHLTVGYRRHASGAALAEAEAAVRAELPVSTVVDRLALMAGSRAADSWRVVAELPLSGAQR